ncbi:response regulator transcription factor [Mariniflexile sp.]|uniref:response regulator transcription factor n=1 Tax=Mariniflexile sp. TaxID=1979402 RepID=UPI003568475A
MGGNIGHKSYITTANDIFLDKISNLINAINCLDNLQVLIYWLEEKKVIYINKALSKIVGAHVDKFKEEGWSYWYSLIKGDELELVKSGINNLLYEPYFQEPFVMKYRILNESGENICLRHEMLLHSIENQMLSIHYFFDVTSKEKMNQYLHIANNNNVTCEENIVALISPREKEVLKLVADGFSSKQIAQKLFISNHTAISHRKNLIEKFNVKNTAQLIKRASRTIAFW